MVSHYRVIEPKATIGLPEVNIGLLPGGQGTQRLPRIIGIDSALEAMTAPSDRTQAPSAQALKWGAVDAVLSEGDFFASAEQFALSKVGQDFESKKVRNMKPPTPQPGQFDGWRARMRKERKGEEAPQAIISCVEGACAGPTFDDGDKVEKTLFGQLLKNAQSKALQYVFFAEREAAKVKGVDEKLAAPIKSLGVMGAGTMGGGISMNFAQIGIPVTIVELNQEALDKGIAIIKKNFENTARRQGLPASMVEQAMANIKGTTSMSDLKDCDAVIEAVFESLSVKKEVFKNLDSIVKPEGYLFTNTSALNIDKIAAETKRPEKVMGTHFFSPANQMKLLENVQGAMTADATIATCMKMGKDIGKWPVLAGNTPGFIGNRMVGLYGNAARDILLSGLTPKQVDDTAEAFGMRMGPLAMSDMVGLDVGSHERKEKGNYFPKTVIQDALLEAGCLGQKNGKGFYNYGGNRERLESAESNALIQAVAKENGRKTESLTPDQVVERLFLPMVNEGFKILEEGFAQRPSDIDVCYVHGYAFPRYRGGPMHYAEEDLGLPRVLNTLKQMNIKPSALLETCVAKNMKLTQFWNSKEGKEFQAQIVKRDYEGNPLSKM